MDLGIRGKRALVCASSKGLGRGCADALAQAGCTIFINGRDEKALSHASTEIHKTYDIKAHPIAADIATEHGQKTVIDTVGEVDILVNNAGGPPPGMWYEWHRQDFIDALDANMLAPIALMKAFLPKMMERNWGRVVNITSQSVKAPIPILGLSNAARTGLTGYVAGTARQIAHKGVTINNLLPGIHATARADALDQNAAKAENIPFKEIRKKRMETIPARRYGTVEEFGATCAFLCSQYAGYIVGQNILLDGGSINATF